MADILLKCSNCDQQLAVDGDAAEQSFECPDCQADISVPASEVSFACPSCQCEYSSTTARIGEFFDCPNCYKPVQVPAEASSVPELTLQRKKARAADVPKATSKLCPHCHSQLPTGSVFCVHCGTDLRTGRQIESGSLSNSGRAFYKNLWVILPTVVALAAIAVAIALYSGKQRRLAMNRAIDQRRTLIMESADSVESIEEAIGSLEALQGNVIAAANHEWTSKIDQSVTELENRREEMIQEKTAEAERQAKAEAEAVRLEEERRIARARKLEEERHEQKDAFGASEEETTERQSAFDRLYSGYLSAFQSPLGKTMPFQLLNGNEIMGDVVGVTDTVVKLTKGKANISLYRDELQLASWLQCSGEDYARYYANKKLGRSQEEYIQAMISKQHQYEEEKKEEKRERELAKKKEASKYKIVHEKVKCPSCGGKGYRSGMRKANGSYSKITCIRCGGSRYVTKTKRVLREKGGGAVVGGGGAYDTWALGGGGFGSGARSFRSSSEAHSYMEQLNRNNQGGLDAIRGSGASGTFQVDAAQYRVKYMHGMFWVVP